MPARGSKLARFILNALINQIYPNLFWLDIDCKIFILHSPHGNNKELLAENLRIFKDWDKLKSRKSHEKASDMKQRLFAALKKSKFFKRFPKESKGDKNVYQFVESEFDGIFEGNTSDNANQLQVTHVNVELIVPESSSDIFNGAESFQNLEAISEAYSMLTSRHETQENELLSMVDLAEVLKDENSNSIGEINEGTSLYSSESYAFSSNVQKPAIWLPGDEFLNVLPGNMPETLDMNFENHHSISDSATLNNSESNNFNESGQIVENTNFLDFESEYDTFMDHDYLPAVNNMVHENKIENSSQENAVGISDTVDNCSAYSETLTENGVLMIENGCIQLNRYSAVQLGDCFIARIKIVPTAPDVSLKFDA